MWRKQIRSGKKDRMIKKKNPGRVLMEKDSEVKWSDGGRMCFTTSGNVDTVRSHPVCHTFLGENTPKVPPSSRIATPISASKASLKYSQKTFVHSVKAFVIGLLFLLQHTLCALLFSPLKIVCAGNSKRMRTDGVQRWSKWFVAWQLAENGTS